MQVHAAILLTGPNWLCMRAPLAILHAVPLMRPFGSQSLVLQLQQHICITRCPLPRTLRSRPRMREAMPVRRAGRSMPADC